MGVPEEFEGVEDRIVEETKRELRPADYDDQIMTLLVGNLPNDPVEEEVLHALKPFGASRVVLAKFTRIGEKYAFVRFRSVALARYALQKISRQGVKVYERLLLAEMANRNARLEEDRNTRRFKNPMDSR